MGVVRLNERVFKHDAQSTGFEPDTHVDLGISFKRLISTEGGSYILEGIRGTGKTHILKMIINEAKANYPKYKVLPAYITIASSPQLAKEDPKYFRIFLYISIIRSVCKFINENKHTISEGENNGLINQLKKLFNLNNKEDDFETNIRKILDMANEIINELFDNPDKIISIVNQKKEAKIGGKIELKGFGINAKKEEKDENEEIKEYNTIKLSDIYGIDVLISFLRTVKNLLKINYIYVLIDECSESNKEIQIEIFRLCKQIRGCCSDGENLSNPDVVFMAAVYPPQSTYYPSTSRKDDFNFQPGHDCTVEYLEIDELNDEFESFFLELIKNRLKLNLGGPTEIGDIFDNEDVIVLAAYASGGVPRRFLEILKQAYNQLNRDFGVKSTESLKKIDSPYVLSAISQVIEGPSLLNDSMLTNEDNVVLEKIIKKFAQRNKTVETKKSASKDYKTPITTYFTTAARSASEIANLISVGVIHDKKRTRSRKSSISAWKGAGILCSIDIGVAIHRGVLSKVPTRILEICRKDLQESSYRGFTYVLDMPLEEESLDLEFAETKEYVNMLEQRMLFLDDALINKKVSEKMYESMVERTTKTLESAKKRLKKIKEQLDEKRKVTTLEPFTEGET